MPGWRKQRCGKAVLACCVLVTALGVPARAAEVRREGNGLFFKAKIGEANTVVVTLVAPAGVDGPNNDTIRITDSSNPVTAVPPCVQQQQGPDAGHAVVCDVPHPSFVSLDLGNQDDTASQTDTASNLSLPMKIFGGLGADTLTGGFAADTIDGGPGVDVLNGNDGDDVITGGSEGDQIQGGRGSDTIDGQLGGDTIDGGLGNDVIHGGGGGDSITGGKGSDKLFGDADGDTIHSQDGEKDEIDCGLGIGNDNASDRDSIDTLKHCRR